MFELALSSWCVLVGYSLCHLPGAIACLLLVFACGNHIICWYIARAYKHAPWDNVGVRFRCGVHHIESYPSNNPGNVIPIIKL